VLAGNYNGTPSHATSALDGIRKQFPSAEVTYTPGMNFLRTETVVPANLLTTPDGKPGLKAEYFTDDLKGTPKVTRVDKTVDLQIFRPDADAITPPEGMRDFSVRWTGFLTPTES